MSGPSATCELWVDGTRVADTGEDLELARVTALDGLSLTWGRDGQNQQPEPASLAMDLIDPYGDDSILDVLHVGSSVQVFAAGEIPGQGRWLQTVDDPTLQSVEYGDVTETRYAQALPGSTWVEWSGTAKVLNLTAWVPNWPRVTVPPRRFSPPGSLPDAWDSIPQWSNDQDQWRVSVEVLAPAGSTVLVNPVVYSSPYPTDGNPMLPGPMVAATGGWQTITFLVDNTGPDLSGWLGVSVAVQDARAWWQDQTDTWADRTDTWAEVGRVWVGGYSVEAPGSDTPRRVLVFSGSITDLAVSPDPSLYRATTIKATAMDLGSTLGNTVVGDTPWPVQALATRAERVAELAGLPAGLGGAPRIKIDSPLGATNLSARDVDAQQAYALLQDQAQSVGGVLWVGTHLVTGPFLWIENPANRSAVAVFQDDGSGQIVITGSTRGVEILSACDILQDGVTWAQDTSDVITVVAVSWLEQGVDEEGQPTTTERAETVTDIAAVATYGTRRLSVSTELITADEAESLALALLAQARRVGWRLTGLTIDTGVGPDREIPSVDDTTRATTLFNLLDGTARLGAAITLVDMPPYAPRGSVSSVYLEGGTYAFQDGYWVLKLATSPTSGIGVSATWQDFQVKQPWWTWGQFDWSILWVDTFGVTL